MRSLLRYAEPTVHVTLIAVALLISWSYWQSKDASSPKPKPTPSSELVSMGDDYGLTAKIQGDRSFERSWVEPDVEKTATLSEGDGYMLYKPVLGRISERGQVYVFDFGDYTVKSFTQEGEYAATYGRGKGRGPGEVIMMSDVGVWRDSLVYVIDPRQRRVSFFQIDGDFVRSESYSVPIARLAWGNSSTKYVVTGPQPGAPLLIIESPERREPISQLSSQPILPIALDGHLHTYHGKAVYVPSYLPVILTFSPDDTTGVALPTPDYGLPRPKAERDGRSVSAPSWRFNQMSTLSKGVLSVGRENSKAGNLLFDLYDLQKMKYMRSVRFPIQRKNSRFALWSLYAHGLEVVASVQGATVEIYEVHTPTK